VADNNLVLIDSILSKQSTGEDKSEVFEVFSFNQILKDFDLSVDEIEQGWVDGTDDGGIDGFYTFIDDRLVTGDVSSVGYRKNPDIELVIITCKHKNNFAQIPINNIISSAEDLFDLSMSADNLTSPFNEDLLNSRELFRKAYIELIDKNPKLRIRFIYASRGDSASIVTNVRRRADLLVQKTQSKFTYANVSFDFVGASELLALYRKTRSFTIRLKYVESAISRPNDSYIILSRLDDYNNFITDEDGKLRRYLFDSNVRDYLPGSLINKDIWATLCADNKEGGLDFWLLNNGITILTSAANVAGKEMSLENIQIVNGLQTTETIYRYFSERSMRDDPRAVLIKVIIANDEVVRDRIIKATNNQNKVDLTNLKATDKLQKDIEELLLEKEWFYDRRKNQYKNLEKPQDRIISVKYLAQGILAICLRKLEAAGKARPNMLSYEGGYSQLFNPSWDLKVYLAVVHIRKSLEKYLRTIDYEKENVKLNAKNFGPLFSYIYVALKLKSSSYEANDLTELVEVKITKHDINKIWKIILAARDEYFKDSGAEKLRRPARNGQFIKIIDRAIKAQLKE